MNWQLPPNYDSTPFLSGVRQGQLLQQQALQNQMLAIQIRREQQELEREEQGQQEQQNVADNPLKIIILSQQRHPVYLGCFNCPSKMPDSIHSNGPYGNTRSRTSIYNYNGMYGSHSSNYSPCNLNASRPPYVIDNRGNVYGLLTLNTRLSNAIREKQILTWLKLSVCTK